MSFKTKKPPIIIKTNKEEFNKLVTIVKESNHEIYDKLMKYTITEEGDSIVLMLFPREGSILFLILLDYIQGVEVKKDYYDQLNFNREIYKRMKKGECKND